MFSRRVDLISEAIQIKSLCTHPYRRDEAEAPQSLFDVMIFHAFSMLVEQYFLVGSSILAHLFIRREEHRTGEGTNCLASIFS